MKKISIVIIVMLLSCITHACVIIHKDQPSHETILPLVDSGKTIRLSEFTAMTWSDYKKMSGEEIGLKEWIGFKFLQYRLKRLIKTGIIAANLAVPVSKLQVKGDAGQHVGWFALGFFLGIYGLIISLVINDDKKNDRIKWTAIGLLSAVVLALALLIILLVSFSRGPVRY
jgi:hypothetical protein